LQQALTMRRRELKWRLKSMQRQLLANTVHDWSKVSSKRCNNRYWAADT